MSETMTSMERLMTALQHQEPDRVPFFLTTTMSGARELGLSIREYFSAPENVVAGQLRMRDKYRDDFVTSFFYAGVETEAWGGETISFDDGPPNAGRPMISKPADIKKLKPPAVEEHDCLLKVIKATAMLKTALGETAPIIGLVISPFSLPVMQMGFDKYLDLLYESPDLFERLMAVNEEFCVSWANAQLKAGATAIGYFDPVSSATILPRDLFLRTGFEIAKRTINRIDGPVAALYASGRCGPILDDLTQIGAAIIGVGNLEDIAELKASSAPKVSLLGNLNGIEMRRWTPEDAEDAVKAAIAKAGRGGGFILADAHGEIPWQVPDEILLAISAAVHKWGRYPLDWIDEYDN